MKSVIVIGAGAAGLSAARKLQDGGVEVQIIEARDRLGGRLWTNRDFADHPIEFGAEFVHGDTISTKPIVESLGLPYVAWKKTDDSMVRLKDGRFLTMQEARKADAEFDAVRAWALPDIQPKEGGETFSAFLTRGGFNPDQIHYVRRMFANAVGGDPDVIDAEQAMHDLNSYAGNDYRLLGGYDRMVNHLAHGIYVKLNCEVTEINWSKNVEVKTKSGEVFAADAAVITLPVGVLSSGKIKFNPGLPSLKTKALSRVVMGPVSKIIFRFDEPVYREDIGAIYSAGCPPMWWSPTVGRAVLKHRVWSAFFSGSWADELYGMGEKAAIEFALNTLRKEMGNPKLTPSASRFVMWRDDPYSYGGYSFCLPGGFLERANLGQQTPPLYWAGEATSPSSTVHGAYDSGLRAASEILAVA